RTQQLTNRCGWTMARLGELCSINPRPNFLPSLLEEDPMVSFVPMSAVATEAGRIDLSATRRLSEVRKGYTNFIDGDLLFAKITPCMENGKVAIARGLTAGIGFGSTEFHVLRPEATVDARFLFYFLLRHSLRSEAKSQMTGTA